MSEETEEENSKILEVIDKKLDELFECWDMQYEVNKLHQERIRDLEKKVDKE